MIDHKNLNSLSATFIYHNPCFWQHRVKERLLNIQTKNENRFFFQSPKLYFIKIFIYANHQTEIFLHKKFIRARGIGVAVPRGVEFLWYHILKVFAYKSCAQIWVSCVQIRFLLSPLNLIQWRVSFSRLLLFKKQLIRFLWFKHYSQIDIQLKRFAGNYCHCVTERWLAFVTIAPFGIIFKNFVNF